MIRHLLGLARRTSPTSLSPPAARVQHSALSDPVSDYYDRFTAVYQAATGDFIQAFRTADTDALMEHIARAAGIEDGMKVLDAGCGVGAPATWLANRYPGLQIDGLTNSARQAELATARIAAAKLDDRVTVTLGDYHDLGDFTAGGYDRVLFLESLGHSPDPGRVIDGVGRVLRPGGSVYIKDFFQRYSSDSDVQAAIDEAIAVINANYCYNVLELPNLVDLLMRSKLTPKTIAQPAIDTDLALTVAFEHAAGRLTYPVFAAVHAVDWYEIMASRD